AAPRVRVEPKNPPGLMLRPELVRLSRPADHWRAAAPPATSSEPTFSVPPLRATALAVPPQTFSGPSIVTVPPEMLRLPAPPAASVIMPELTPSCDQLDSANDAAVNAPPSSDSVAPLPSVVVPATPRPWLAARLIDDPSSPLLPTVRLELVSLMVPVFHCR